MTKHSDMLMSKKATTTRKVNTGPLLAELNRYTRTDALAAFAPALYRGGPVAGLKLWVGPDALGRELLAHWNRETDRELQKQEGEFTPETIERRRRKAYECNKDRVRVFVRDLKRQNLVFFRVDIREDGFCYDGSPRGREEADFLAGNGVIESRRDARFRPAFSRGASSYIEIPAGKIKSVRGLAAHARMFDRGARVEAAIEKIGKTASPAPEKIGSAFNFAVQGLQDRNEIAEIRRQFAQAVTARYGHGSVPNLQAFPQYKR